VSKAQKLIENGANVMAHHKNRCYPLFYAVLNKNFEMLELLLKNGAYPDTCNHSHIPTHAFIPLQLDYVEFSGRKILYDPFYYAIKLNQESMVQKFCEFNYDVKKKIGDTIYTYPIVAAAKFQNEDIFNYLLEKEVDVNMKDYTGETTLMYCCSANNPQMVNQVLQRGILRKDTSNTGYTPLMYASEVHGIKMSIIDSLISKGVDINQRNTNNQSALSLACLHNNRDVALRLFQYGAIAKDSKTDFESNAFTNHFYGDYFLSKGDINNCKGFYLKAKQYYNDCIPLMKEELSDIKKQKKIDKVLEAIPYVVAVAVGRTDAVIQDMLTNRQYSAINTTIIYDQQPPVNASLDEFAIYYKNRITQFESSVALIDGIMACIEKGFTGQELNSCIKSIQLPNNK
jgi:ankyrin repeat protein